jgi:hydroxymethylpyrimidine pyrophosphatase-like HAD family hydrolase
VENDDEDFFHRVQRAYPAHRLVHSLDEIIGQEPCCKISLYSTESAETQAYKLLSPLLGEEVSFTLSGGHWCDVAAKTANKGTALQEIQRLFSIPREDCAAFGDHMNDLQLFSCCAHTFAPENAYPPIKALATEIIPSNRERGVPKTLQKLFDQGAFL